MWSQLLSFIASQFLFFALHTERTNSFPRPLSREQEKECFQLAAQGDLAARNKLIEHNLRLVAHIVKKYTAVSADQDDLQSIGTIGLIKAVETFSPEKNTRFSSYAARCIENAILSDCLQKGLTNPFMGNNSRIAPFYVISAFC